MLLNYSVIEGNCLDLVVVYSNRGEFTTEISIKGELSRRQQAAVFRMVEEETLNTEKKSNVHQLQSYR